MAKSYNFKADVDCHIEGYVVANSEKEAIKKIRSWDWIDLLDETIDDPIRDIKIISEEELD